MSLCGIWIALLPVWKWHRGKLLFHAKKVISVSFIQGLDDEQVVSFAVCQCEEMYCTVMSKKALEPFILKR
jgi:hypothetical protein